MIPSELNDVIRYLINLFSIAKALIPLSPTTANNDDAEASTSRSTDTHMIFNYQKLHDQITKCVADLIFIRNAAISLQDLLVKVRMQFDTLRLSHQEGIDFLNSELSNLKPSNSFDINVAKRIQFCLTEVTEMMMELKHHIPYPLKLNLESHGVRVRTVRSVGDLFNVLFELEAYKEYRHSSTFIDFEEKFERLEPEFQICLLYLSVFPEGAVLNKRMLMYWWRAEGFLDLSLRHVWYTLLNNEYIQPVLKNKKYVGFRMHPLIRFAVIFLAEKLDFFSFDSEWNPSGDFSSCRRAFLVENEEGNSRDIVMSLNPEKLVALLNISDRKPDLKLKWFSKMRNAKVLCLGGWEENTSIASASHIKVEDTKFLKGLKNMKHLKFLSLRGISGIDKLPRDVMKLTNLITLDLKACRDLEALPNSIGSLQHLRHLDISDCYLLERMPKGIELLSDLQVLKGFVVTTKKEKGACSISDLSRIPLLQKLSIRTTKRNFPTDEELVALKGCRNLESLSIVWVGTSDSKPETRESSALKRLSRSNAFTRKNNQQNTTLAVLNRETMPSGPKLPHRLRKLNLQSFPETKAPSWLMPKHLMRIRKLYIKGGNLQDLNQVEDDGGKWEVNILHLEDLPGLNMQWMELKNAFPELIYLKKVNCPNLTSFPCDQDGLWLGKILPEESFPRLGLNLLFILQRRTERKIQEWDFQ